MTKWHKTYMFQKAYMTDFSRNVYVDVVHLIQKTKAGFICLIDDKSLKFAKFWVW